MQKKCNIVIRRSKNTSFTHICYECMYVIVNVHICNIYSAYIYIYIYIPIYIYPDICAAQNMVQFPMEISGYLQIQVLQQSLLDISGFRGS